MILRNINVIDVEATCWEGKDDVPAGQQSEIIEIGICQVDIKKLERSKKRSILIKPRHSTVSQFCTQLTTITQKMLDENGVDVTEAARILTEEYDSSYIPWASYGFYDQKMFREWETLYHIRYPLHNRHTNVKYELALMSGADKEVGMDRALTQLGLPMEGTHHRGVDDAYNIANILIWMMSRFRRP
jgi:inhibitor of KinA sporulation pathway (predicted exonuclease)